MLFVKRMKLSQSQTIRRLAKPSSITLGAARNTDGLVIYKLIPTHIYCMQSKE